MLILSQSDEHTTWTRSLWSSVGEMWSSSGSSWGLKEDSSIKTCPQSRFGLNIETIQDFFLQHQNFWILTKCLMHCPERSNFRSDFLLVRERSWELDLDFHVEVEKTHFRVISHWASDLSALTFLRVPHRMQLQIVQILEWILCRMIFWR